MADEGRSGAEGDDILGIGMVPPDSSPITSPDDPRLVGVGDDDIGGADQIAGLLAATPDERLDGLVAMLDFLEEARAALHTARPDF